MQGFEPCRTDTRSVSHMGGERTKINYKYRIAQYIDLVKNEYLYLVFRARAFTFSKVFEKACNVCRNSCTIFLFIGRTDIAGCSMLICTPLYFEKRITLFQGLYRERG